MKKRGFIIAVLIIISLVTASVVGAKALYETKPVPTKERHTIRKLFILNPNGKRLPLDMDSWKGLILTEKEKSGWSVQ